MFQNKPTALEIVSNTRHAGGDTALRQLAAIGYKGPIEYTHEELNAIQDEAKRAEATLDHFNGPA